jgi:hypothetical protein
LETNVLKAVDYSPNCKKYERLHLNKITWIRK